MKTIEVVAAVIYRQHKVFATQRGYGDFKGGWEFPGGKIELNETPQQALIREIKEELEVNIEVKDLLNTIEYDYPNFHLRMHCFWCRIHSGEVTLKEHTDAKWLTASELNSLQWLPADIELIPVIKEKLRDLY